MVLSLLMSCAFADPTTATAAAGAPTTSALVGQPAPEFTLKDLAGNDVSLASFRGKTVVLAAAGASVLACDVDEGKLDRLRSALFRI